MSTDLIPDLTAAIAGSRDLSDRVLLALGWTKHPAADPRTAWRLPNGELASPFWPRLFGAPNPTVNLQDAVDLVPAGLHWMARTRATPLGKHTAEGVVQTPGLMSNPDYFATDEFGHTAPLALCIAILKYVEAAT